MRGILLVLAPALLVGCAVLATPGVASVCPFPQRERAWLEPALAEWREVMDRDFHHPVAAAPRIFVLGRSCVWTIGSNSVAGTHGQTDVILFHGVRIPVRGSSHSGAFRAPHGKDVSAAPAAFTALGEEGAPFFLITDSEIWRSVFAANELDQLSSFLRAVSAHELTHTQQAGLLLRLEHEANEPGIGDVDGDEFLQQRFGDNPEYVTAMTAEREALLAALHEPNEEVRRRMAGAITTAYRTRQERFLTGNPMALRDLEDDFLSMEGVAVWVSYRIDNRADAAHIAAIYESPRHGSWVQMHGVLFAALLDTFGPRWRAAAMGPEQRRLPELLEREAR